MHETTESEATQLHVVDTAAEEVVELGNRLAEMNPDTDPWDIASGLLAGAVHYWLYTRQPCDDPDCDACMEVSTAERRIRLLMEETHRYAADSNYFHSPNDADAGTA